MANIIPLKEPSGVQFYPQTHEKAVVDSNGVNLQTKLASITTPTYVTAWDGASTPVVANIPAGVTVTYNTTTYTGTLAASSSTLNKIYLVGDNNGNFDEYITQVSGSTYSWLYLGNTSIVLSDYATKDELNQLDQKLAYSGLMDGFLDALMSEGTITTAGAATTSKNWNRWVVKNKGYSHINITLGGYSGFTALAFYNSDTWNANTLISKVASKGGTQTIDMDIPAGTETIVFASYLSALAYPSLKLYIPDLEGSQDELFEGTRAKFGVDDALYCVRNVAGSPVLDDDPNGNRIRIIWEVKKGDVLVASTTDAGGIISALYGTVENAMNAGATGRTQLISSVFKAAISSIINDDGYLMLSMTRDSAVISETEMATMLASLSAYVYRPMAASYPALQSDVATLKEQMAKVDITDGVEYTGERIFMGQQYRRTLLGAASSFGTPTMRINRQGGAVYGDILIQGSAEDSTHDAGIYFANLKTRAKLGEFTFGNEAENMHTNCLNIGAKVADSDLLPLLYVSESRGDMDCWVLRVTDSYNAYTLYNKIHFVPGSTYADLQGIDWMLDADNGFIWAMPRLNDNWDITFLKFSAPALTGDGSTINVTEADILDSFSYRINPRQGGFIQNGKMYLSIGYNTTASPALLWVIDLASHQIVTRVPLSGGEPEFVSPYDGGMLFATPSNYFKLEF